MPSALLISSQRSGPAALCTVLVFACLYMRVCVCVRAEVLIALLLNAPKLIDSDASSNLSDPGCQFFGACALIRRLTLNGSTTSSLVCLLLFDV